MPQTYLLRGRGTTCIGYAIQRPQAFGKREKIKGQPNPLGSAIAEITDILEVAMIDKGPGSLID
jgi:hypothetical protein